MIRFLRKPEVRRITGWSNSTIARKEKAGLFPKRYQLGDSTVAWRNDEVAEWSKMQVPPSEYWAFKSPNKGRPVS
ncbi:MAG: AlpA family transcriptional regulator [Gemmatimonadales bacterium]|nr:AlpA family transcriptional regulator [Gemmatimonadales bacterium]